MLDSILTWFALAPPVALACLILLLALIVADLMTTAAFLAIKGDFELNGLAAWIQGLYPRAWPEITFVLSALIALVLWRLAPLILVVWIGAEIVCVVGNRLLVLRTQANGKAEVP